jgi:two-component system nitrogen regulation sensor histidine kinase NtrY
MRNPANSESHAAKDANRRRARRVWLIGGVAVLFLAMLAALQVAGLWNIVTPDDVADTLALDALSSFVFVAFIIFAFVFLRSFLKLQRERRAGRLGSKIKTRLVRYFIAISILPMATMAIFSYLFFNRSIEKWFGSLPENVVQEARAERIEDVSEIASLIAAQLENQSSPVNEQTFERFVASGNLAALELVTPRGDVLLSRLAAANGKDDAGRNLSANAALQTARSEISSGIARGAQCESQFCFAFLPLQIQLNSGDAATARLVVVRTDPHLSRIAAGAETFQYLRSRQKRLRYKALLTVGLVTLLSLFASMWIALHLARGISTPIAALSEAAHEVARGNLHYRVKTLAEDELALLAASFNDMTMQLEENRRKIEANSQLLREKNLALVERRHYIETVLESLSNGVISLDADERITTMNAAAWQLLCAANRNAPNENDSPNGEAAMRGFANVSSVIGKRLQEVLSAEDYAVLAPVVRRAKRAGRASQQAELARRSAETEANRSQSEANATLNAVPIALTATAIGARDERASAKTDARDSLERSASKRARGVVLVIEDLTELLTAQRAAAWSEVARRMAHEIKNPLTPIQLSAERIARSFARLTHGSAREIEKSNGVETSSRNGSRASDIENVERIINECAATITREVAALQAMVDEFARFARLPAPKFEQADVNEIVRQSLALYEDRLGDVRLEARLADELPSALLDAEQMRRVIVNLIDNALEAIESDAARRNNSQPSVASRQNDGLRMNSDSQIAARAIQSGSRITVATAFDPSRQRLLIEIADTGHGIAPQDRARLFQPYFSTRGRGTGLGLAIVQRIISEHGGRIRAESNYPKGAKFIVELPMMRGQE